MRKEKGKTYEQAPWCGVSSWSSFHPMRVAHEAGAGGGVIPVIHQVLSPIIRRVLSPVIRHCSTHGLPHEQLLVRLGQVVHCRLSSIIIVPSRLLFPRCLSFVVPSVVCHRRRRTALVHLQSTRRAVAHQHGGGCSVVHRHCPHRHRCHPCHRHSSLFVGVIPVCRRHSLSSFVVVVCPSIHPCHSLSTVVLRRLSSIPLFHPQSTPRAVAHEAGGGWRCHCQGWWQ
jgi:hypothetical protein